MKKVRELAAEIYEGRGFEAEGTASVKVPKQNMSPVLQGAEQRRGVGDEI